MRDVDVVIAATSSAETLLSRDDIENLMKARRNRPLLLIDLSVPRNIDPAVTGLDHVSLFNIDDLEAAGSPGRSGSRARVDRVPSNYRGARRGADRETSHRRSAKPLEIGATTAFNHRSYSTTNVGKINDGCASLTAIVSGIRSRDCAE